MIDIKSKISTVCGVIILVCGVVLALPLQGLVIPTGVTSIATIVLSICGGIIGVLTGKNPDGSSKTAEQVQKQMNEKAVK